MKKVLLISVITFGALMVSCNTSKQSNEQKEEITDQTSSEITAIRIAMSLAKYGYEAESASALIEAADILSSVSTQELEAEIEKGTETADQSEKAEKAQITPVQLIADAREFTEDANLLAIADKILAKMSAQSEGARGALGGPKRSYSSVNANSSDNYVVKFWAKELAEILVSGDGDTDLDLYVYDENGNLVASDTDYSDDCYARFRPAWTGPFRIKIVNRGRVYNRYVIVTN